MGVSFRGHLVGLVARCSLVFNPGSSCDLHSSVLVELRREAEIKRKATDTVFVVVREGWGEFLVCFLSQRFILWNSDRA